MIDVIDYGLLRGVITALVFAAFVGVFVWAYSARRESDFQEASQLPLDDNPVPQAVQETRHDQ